MRAKLLTTLVAAGVASACAEPNLNEYEAHTGIVTGTILYPRGTARGNVIVFLFREDNPPPPEGTGRPVNFIVVPGQQLFGDVPEAVAADFAAPYTMPTVQPGRYRVRAFLDADGNFNPTQDLLAQATAGDVGGGHVDLATQELLPVVVEADRITAQVTISLGFVFPVERPVFSITSTATYTVPYATPRALELRAHPVQRGPIQLDPARTAFLLQYVDLDEDGTPDDENGDHLPDLYPTVLLRRRPTPDLPGTIVVPGIIDPLPWRDALDEEGFALTTRLQVILPPVSVAIGSDGSRVLSPEVPPGEYETVLISGTGQTWTVPNVMDALLPDANDLTQSALIRMVAGDPLPPGRIEGTVRTANDHRADTYVIAFSAAALPPPAGTGRPVALASVPAAAFVAREGSAIEAPFAISGLPDGQYVLRGFADVDGTFSPLADLIAQPSAADWGGGSTPALITVARGTAAPGVVVDLSTPVTFDRPVFDFDVATFPQASLPRAFSIRSHPLPFYGATEASGRLPVALAGADVDGDNYPDLLPRVLLTRIADGIADPRAAPDDPAGIVIPGIVDPLPFLGPLSGGTPLLAVSELRVILPPAAVRLGAAGARELISPPPAGRYRVNVLSATGQTWSVPSNLDLVLQRVGTALEDETQARVITISESARPGGAISGTIQLVTAIPAGDFSVVVLAFDVRSPPPPVGSGRPVASAVVGKAAFSPGGSAPYLLGGLATGTYQVRAYLDANDNFTAWFETRNQPDAGDVGGGHLSLAQGTLEDVDVSSLGAPVTGIDVSIVPPLAFTTDRPVFTFSSTAAVLNPSAGPLPLVLDAVEVSGEVLDAAGVFPIQWVDLDGNGTADDRNGDGNPDVFPLVVAELLDPEDPENLTVASPSVRIPGIVSPFQFAAAGFPAADPSATRAVLEARRMTVVFPPIAVDAAGTRIAPPAGRYRVTLVNPRGQTWSTPNELSRATGTELPATQAGHLEVR